MPFVLFVGWDCLQNESTRGGVLFFPGQEELGVSDTFTFNLLLVGHPHGLGILVPNLSVPGSLGNWEPNFRPQKPGG